MPPGSRPCAAVRRPPRRNRARLSWRRRLLRGAAVAAVSTATITGAGSYVAYSQLDGNISVLDTGAALGSDRPAAFTPAASAPEGSNPGAGTPSTAPGAPASDRSVPVGEAVAPLNILLIGSDTRQGAGNSDAGGETPGLSDTTIVLHLSADRSRAYAVSIPRDSMVQRPTCLTEDGQVTDPGGLSMFNAAYAVGGPVCTQRTVEQLTGIRIDHFAVIDFSGFRHMVDALGGVPICVPKTVDDPVSGIHLEAGSYEVGGQQALDYVRIRHEISDNGDIGRMRRQQAFLASMVRTAVSRDVLTDPVGLYRFLDEATRSLTTDPGLGDLPSLLDLARQVQHIGLDRVQFLTVPFEAYAPDPNRLQWSRAAEDLWAQLRTDQPLTPERGKTVISAAPIEGTVTGSMPPEPPSASTEAPVDGAGQATADANGLCSA
jgi:LCP family protein required for cell wall assembly